VAGQRGGGTGRGPAEGDGAQGARGRGGGGGGGTNQGGGGGMGAGAPTGWGGQPGVAPKRKARGGAANQTPGKRAGQTTVRKAEDKEGKRGGRGGGGGGVGGGGGGGGFFVVGGSGVVAELNGSKVREGGRNRVIWDIYWEGNNIDEFGYCLKDYM